MSRDDWMLFILTFLTGAAIGMYIYVAVWKPVYAPEELGDDETVASEWSVVGKRRGGNHDSDYIQPSFRLLGNGSYTYIEGGANTEPSTPKEGKLRGTKLSDLKVSVPTLKNYEGAVNNANCASLNGGYDYEYRFTVRGETYYLDTCETKLGTETPLASDLAALWLSFSGHNQREYDSVSEWVEAWINRNVGVPKDE